MPGQKYTPEERAIAHRISKLKEKQRELRVKYLNLDVQINQLKQELNGKYKDHVKTVR